MPEGGAPGQHSEQRPVPPATSAAGVRVPTAPAAPTSSAPQAPVCWIMQIYQAVHFPQ